MTRDPDPEPRPLDPAWQHGELIYDWNLVDQARPEKRVSLDDETLRDGLQSPSIYNPRVDQKIEILHLMADLGIDTADLGLPGAGPHVVEHVTRLAQEIASSRLPIRANCAARTVIADIQPIADITQKTGVPIEAAMFIGSSPIRRYTEDWDLDRMLRSTEESVAFAVKCGLEAMYVTEDTTRADPETVKRLYQTAIRCGARRVVVCDTVGHATPAGVRALLRYIRSIVDETGEVGVKVDWHGHNDRGLGVTNALTAIVAGADQVHGCALGIGERCGNTAIDQLLVNLKLLGWREADLTKLPEYCRAVGRACRVPIPHNYPVVGNDAFETGTGVHACAVVKAYRKGDSWLANRIYSGVPADDFGLEQRIVVGPMSGRSNVEWWLEKRGYEPTKERVDKIFAAAKKSNRTLTDEEILHIVEERQLTDEWSFWEVA